MIGIIIVTFNSADVIEACLSSLIRSHSKDFRFIVCDNNSKDETVSSVRLWATEQSLELDEIGLDQFPRKTGSAFGTLLHTGRNLGFAGGVNAGINYLKNDPHVSLFWILNPDSEVLPDTVTAYAERAEKVRRFSLMGGRILDHADPSIVQSDGGKIKPWSGICASINSGVKSSKAIPPNSEDLDFVSGANMVASREFIDRIGLMVEDYFLYYEEVDWAARRGDLPLVYCQEAATLHHGGTAINSGPKSMGASPFANYFNFRNRRRFLRRFRPWCLPTAWILSMLRILKLTMRQCYAEAWSAFTGLNDLRPPKAVLKRIEQSDQPLAFEAWDPRK